MLARCRVVVVGSPPYATNSQRTMARPDGHRLYHAACNSHCELVVVGLEVMQMQKFDDISEVSVSDACMWSAILIVLGVIAVVLFFIL